MPQPNNFNKNHLLKHTGDISLVPGIELVNFSLLGRDKALESKNLDYLEAGESRHFDVEISLLDNIEEFNAILQKGPKQLIFK